MPGIFSLMNYASLCNIVDSREIVGGSEKLTVALDSSNGPQLPVRGTLEPLPDEEGAPIRTRNISCWFGSQGTSRNYSFL